VKTGKANPKKHGQDSFRHGEHPGQRGAIFTQKKKKCQIPNKVPTFIGIVWGKILATKSILRKKSRGKKTPNSRLQRNKKETGS